MPPIPHIVKGKDGRAHMIHGMASAATVAWVVYQKYFNGMPLYRQEQDWKQCGAKISRATLANWIIGNADEFLQPMYDFIFGGSFLKDSLSWQMRPHCRCSVSRAAGLKRIPKGKQLDYTQPSVQGVMYVNKLFALEDEINKKNKTFDTIKEARIMKEEPVIEGFLLWLDKQKP